MEKLIILVAVVIVGSATCSMVEAALFSVPLNKAKIFKEQKKKGSKELLDIKENMHRPITTVVVFTNIFNILGSMMVGIVAVNVFGSAWLGIISAVFTFLVILFSEIIPKSMGDAYAPLIALSVARPLAAITKLFSPFIWFVDLFTRPFSKKRKTISEEEIKMLSHLSHLEGSIETDEKEMIQKIFKLNDLSAEDIMTPRTVVEALEDNATIGEIENRIYSIPHSRLPVYKKNLDNIVGVCHQRDLLIALSKGEKDRKAKEFIREKQSLFVNSKMKIDNLILLFQKKRAHLAIVKDDFGGTAGIVTLEDALEQIVGEIVDETDKEVDLKAKAKTKNP